VTSSEVLTTSSPATPWAISTLAFFGFFRLGELLPEKSSFDPTSQLAWGDVAVDNHQLPRMVQVHLKLSKCDQFGSGSDIVIGQTDADICPVQALVDYVSKRGDKPGPFFTIDLRQPVTKSWFVAQFRSSLSVVGLPQFEYAGHTFRIGAATTAALVGMEDSTIQTLGRWHSAAFLQYIRMPKHKLAAMSKALAHGQAPPS
jgi:hypothetical protein